MAGTGCRRWFAAGLLLSMFAAPATAAVRWDAANLAALRALVASVADEGLNPADYDPVGLLAAGDGGSAEADAIADRKALQLAHDMFEGRRDLGARPNWHFDRPAVDYQIWLDTVLASHSIALSFGRLLPEGEQYPALRVALSSCRRSGGDCSAIRLNMDRWRVLPRQFGTRYLWVNIPAFRVDLIEDGKVVASHRVIVGKVGTRTPLFTASVTGVTANPWWNVPCSIVDESIGKLVRDRPAEAAQKGFVSSMGTDGKLVVRQKPGPANALGRLKFEMPNPYGVYLHDTPTRELFDRDTRALSHGCIRTDRPDDLARSLLGVARAQELDTALLGFDTRTIRLPAAVPVYVVYITVEADEGAQSGIRRHRDVYGEDAREMRVPSS